MKRILLSAAFLAALSASAQSTTVSKYVSTESAVLNTELLQDASMRMYRPIFHGYNTLCLPFALSADEFAAAFGSDARIEKAVGAITEGDAFTLCFSECTGEGIEAGMPYLIYSNAYKYVRLSNSTGYTVAAPLAVSFGDAQGNAATFRGSFERFDPVGSWAIPATEGEVPSDLICTDGQRHLNPTRCYFTWDAQKDASSMAIRHLNAGETVTGIHAATISSDAPAYNAAGQRVKEAHGVVIRSGKAAIVK